jgi:CubicO group peptidase (beta-lactamase class C family)
MLRLDRLLADAVARRDVPFAVAIVADRDGIVWQGSAGRATQRRVAAPDTLFRIFSMTKAIGSLAALILADRGLLSLETPVVSVLPEFSDIRVMESLGPIGPVLRPPRHPVTLRHLLTHTAGFAYGTWNREQTAWHEFTGMPHVLAGTLASLNYPLHFEPGQEFSYGIGYDWAARMIERIDGRQIDHFCQEEIFGPLGMVDTAFEPDAARDRLAELKIRGEDGKFTAIELSPAPHPEFYGLGGTLYSTALDYIQFLRLVLNQGSLNGRRVISAPTMDLMMVNQIGSMSVPVMKSVNPQLSADVDLVPGTRMTHTIGLFRNETGIPGGRGAGSLTWAGAANTHFWIDPVNDIAAVLMTQSFPFCEPRFMDTYAAYEQAVYMHLDEPAEHQFAGHFGGEPELGRPSDGWVPK